MDRRVHMVEVYDELAELVLGVFDLASDLGTLGGSNLVGREDCHPLDPSVIPQISENPLGVLAA